MKIYFQRLFIVFHLGWSKTACEASCPSYSITAANRRSFCKSQLKKTHSPPFDVAITSNSDIVCTSSLLLLLNVFRQHGLSSGLLRQDAKQGKVYKEPP